MSIELSNISKKFGDFVALDNVSLRHRDRRAGRAAGALGLGQDHAAADNRRTGDSRQRRSAVHGEDASAVSVRERKVGFVFQHYALFRHMTVFENVAFGMRVRPRRARPAEAEIRAPRA